MIAVIKSAVKTAYPITDVDSGEINLTTMIVVEVDFNNDDGSNYSHQSYAVKPEDLGNEPKEYFQRQADTMQVDIDLAEQNAPQAQDQAAADEAIAKLLS